MKRIISVLLAVMMIVTLTSVTAFARAPGGNNRDRYDRQDTYYSDNDAYRWNASKQEWELRSDYYDDYYDEYDRDEYNQDSWWYRNNSDYYWSSSRSKWVYSPNSSGTTSNTERSKIKADNPPPKNEPTPAGQSGTLYDPNASWMRQSEDWAWSMQLKRWVRTDDPLWKTLTSGSVNGERWRVVTAAEAINNWTADSVCFVMPDKSVFKSGNVFYAKNASDSGQASSGERWEGIYIQHLVDKGYKKTLVLVLDQATTRLTVDHTLRLYANNQALVFKKSGASGEWGGSGQRSTNDDQIYIDMRW